MLPTSCLSVKASKYGQKRSDVIFLLSSLETEYDSYNLIF